MMGIGGYDSARPKVNAVLLGVLGVESKDWITRTGSEHEPAEQRGDLPGVFIQH